MTHYTIIGDKYYAKALRRGVVVVIIRSTEKYNVGDNVIVTEHNEKGDYVTGNQLYTVIDSVTEIYDKNKEKHYLCKLNVMNNSHS